MLSCSCEDYDGEPGSWFYFFPEDFKKLNTSRRKRCKSCDELISIGSDVLIFIRYRAPYDEIEHRIKGDEIPIANYYLCEKCGEIYLNLMEAGYCLDITEEMSEYLNEYHELTGFKNNEHK